MRDNGLTATAYTSMGGIDPLVAEPVLAALADAGIAAYATPPGETPPGNAGDRRQSSAAAGQGPVEQDGPGPTPAAPGDSASDSSQDAESAGESPAKADTPAKAEAAVEADVPAKAEAAVEAEIAGESSSMIPAGFEELFVDSGSVERARAVIDRSTEDAEWQSLVEQFNAPSAPGHDAPVPRWPASEDVDENYEPLIDVPAGLIVGDDSKEEEPDEAPRRRDDPHDHYIPPEPPRGPRLDWISRAAWLGLIGGPVLLIVAALLDFDAGGRIMLIAVVGFIAGFLTLVIRMKDRLPPDDTPDDGAVV